MVLTGLVVCQCYRGSVYVQHSTQGYSDPQFLGYVDHMPKVLERKLKRKARKKKLGKKAPSELSFCIRRNSPDAKLIVVFGLRPECLLSV